MRHAKHGVKADSLFIGAALPFFRESGRITRREHDTSNGQLGARRLMEAVCELAGLRQIRSVDVLLHLLGQLRIDREPGQPALRPDVPVGRRLLGMVERRDGHIQALWAERSEQGQVGEVEQEVQQYISYRLQVAGCSRPVFTSSAVKKLFQLSGGIPRLLNLICDRALLGGYSQQKALIDAGLINQAASEVLAIKPQPEKAAWPVWLWPVLTLVALGVGAGLSAFIW